MFAEKNTIFLGHIFHNIDIKTICSGRRPNFDYFYKMNAQSSISYFQTFADRKTITCQSHITHLSLHIRILGDKIAFAMGPSDGVKPASTP